VAAPTAGVARARLPADAQKLYTSSRYSDMPNDGYRPKTDGVVAVTNRVMRMLTVTN